MNFIYLVVAMAAVTYIPRMLPMVLLQKAVLPPFVQRFMRFIPCAALSALVFPGVFASTGDGNLAAAVAGCGVAIALAWRAINLVFVVLGGVVGVLLVKVFF